MKKAALICLMLLPALAFAQVKVTKVVRVHYGNAKSIAALVGGGMPVNVDADNNLQVIVLKGMPDNVNSVEQAIHELDVPSTAPVSKDIEVIVSVIGASSGSDLPAGQEMPETMAPVVKQLRAIFPYKNYQLLSSMLLRSREGARAESKGIMKPISGTSSHPSDYNIAYDDTSTSVAAVKPVIHLRNFRFFAAVPVQMSPSQYTRSDVGLVTDVDLPEGQKTVIGKANVESSDSALFVVLTAKLVD
jgi:hypothetical protein